MAVGQLFGLALVIFSFLDERFSPANAFLGPMNEFLQSVVSLAYG